MPLKADCFYYCLFRIDKDRNGRITADELQQALSNGNQTVGVTPAFPASFPGVGVTPGKMWGNWELLGKYRDFEMHMYARGPCPWES